MFGTKTKTEEKSPTTFRPDTMEDISNSDLVQLSRKLLDATVKSTNILDMKDMTPEKLREAKLVLGFLNSTNNVMKARLMFFKMIGVDEKVKEIRKKSKHL